MVRIMPQPWKHPKTGKYYYRKVVPSLLRAALTRTEYRISLDTKDLREAKLKYPEVAAKVDAELAQAAGGPIVLTLRQIAALAGLWYRGALDTKDEQLQTPDEYEANLDSLQSQVEIKDDNPDLDSIDVAKARAMVARDVDELLKRQGLIIAQRSREELQDRLFWLKINALNALKRRAEGDFRPDDKLSTFPPWVPPNGAAAVRTEPSGLTFKTLFEAWKIERKPPKRTEYEWERVLGRLKEHVGFEDAARLTDHDVVGWKDALLASGKSAKTVSNHLLVLNALFNWAVKNKRMASNPAKGIVVMAKKEGGKRRLPYNDADAKLLLTAARSEKGARRWVPWLLAFTGARLEEVCQALVSDIREESGVWYLDINADGPGKSLKTPGSARRVPLHHAVLDEGFLQYTRSLPKDGPLFGDLTPDRFGKRGGNGTKIIGRWVRACGISDPRKVPNHSWRHRFKDLCRDAGIEKAVHDALTGHTSRDVGDSYGLGYSLKVLAEAIAKLPSPVDAERASADL